MAERAHDPRFAILRQQAERLVSSREDITQLSVEAINALIHELRVHQIELQLQNEELLQARQDTEAERDRFAELYDSVPVGCLTLDRQDVILEANRASHLLLVGPSR
ncbi:MAG: GGDEF domain-containing protein, partial [Candidatus Tectomicrobia bacterium]|nr:GGDEF domain-containing protein [Candidatus Tectomicrobia bacterium]